MLSKLLEDFQASRKASHTFGINLQLLRECSLVSKKHTSQASYKLHDILKESFPSLEWKGFLYSGWSIPIFWEKHPELLGETSPRNFQSFWWKLRNTVGEAFQSFCEKLPSGKNFFEEASKASWRSYQCFWKKLPKPLGEASIWEKLLSGRNFQSFWRKLPKLLREAFMASGRNLQSL